VWQNAILAADDQLRQRVAWSLSQIFVVSAAELVSDENEAWVTYYDIFVHHAFGNYFDIMKEVSVSPVMGKFLTFIGNKAQSNGKYPDENFAREIMQLFSIGIETLNQDGTVKVDAKTGVPLAPYDNYDITAFARVWTGWTNRPMRGNIQANYEHMSTNFVDPMMLHSSLRDRFPKTTLDGGYLGDAFAVCEDLPPQAFLLQGAKYHRTGSKSTLGATFDNADGKLNGKIREHFVPDPTKSKLYAALCDRNAKSGKCTFPADLALPSTIGCIGKVECGADTLVAIKMIDGDRVVYYSYIEPPCVQLAFFDEGKKVGQHWANQCAAPNVVGASGTACCQVGADPGVVASKGGDECLYIAEPMKFATAQDRCAAEYENGIVCPVLPFGQSSFQDGSSADWLGACAGNQYTWRDSDCSLKVQVQPSGEVNIHDPLTEDFREDLRV
jgi:cullin-associated NEDD8-dissociated protein 1